MRTLPFFFYQSLCGCGRGAASKEGGDGVVFLPVYIYISAFSFWFSDFEVSKKSLILLFSFEERRNLLLTMVNYYRVLGLEPGASKQDVDQKYTWMIHRSLSGREMIDWDLVSLLSSPPLRVGFLNRNFRAGQRGVSGSHGR